MIARYKRAKQRLMHKIFVARFGCNSVELKPVRMTFHRMLDELEQAEEEGRTPRLHVGRNRTLSMPDFEEFCREHALIEAGEYEGLRVFIKPDFIWPPPQRANYPGYLAYAGKSAHERANRRGSF